MPMTEQQYSEWVELWKREHPNQEPPSFEAATWLMEAFSLTTEDIGVA